MLLLHRWLGLIAGLLILVAAGTAIGLNHQDWFRRAPMTTDGPFSKYVLSTAVDPSDPQRILMGTNDGFFRSLDGGKSWEEIVLPVPAEQAGAIIFDSGTAGRVYVAFREIGLYRSDDHGDIWEEVALPFYPPEGIHLAGLALDAQGQVTLATTAGLYRQRGSDWESVGSAPPAPKANAAIQLIYDLHDGRFWGSYGVPITDAVSGSLIVLVLSGYFLFFGREIRRRLARRKAAVAPAREKASV
jgi:ligand-binding sensor domain-containing protein